MDKGKKRPAKSSKSRFYFWRKHKWAILALTLVSMGLYIGTVGFDYVLDDTIVIQDNNYTKKGFAGLWDILTTESFQGYFGEQKDLVVGARYRPLSIMMFAMEYGIFGLSPGVSHFVNALLYTLLVLLLFRIISLIKPVKKEHHWFFSLAFVATLIYALHPVHIEAVANIKGRDEVLSAIFSLLTLFYSWKWIKSDRKIYLLWASVAFFLGMLAKENTITFLAIVPLTLFVFTKRTLKKVMTPLVPLLGVTIVYLIMRYQIIGYLLNFDKEIIDLLNNPFYGMDASEKLATVFYTLLLYIKLLFFPHPLTHDYYPYHIPKMNWSDIWPIVSIVTYTALGIWALWSIRKKSIIAYCILFFIITLSIASNLVINIGTFMNERFLFVPSVGFAFLMGYVITRMLPKKMSISLDRFYSVGGVILAVLIAGYMFKNVQRIPAWKNGLALNASSIKVSKNSTRANCFMGTAIFKEFQKKQGSPEEQRRLLDEAEQYIDKSISIHSIYKNALQMKSGILAEKYGLDGDIDKLLSGFHNILKIRQVDYINTYLEYLNKRGQHVDKLNDFYHTVGFDYYAQQVNRNDLALRYLNYAITLDPNDRRIRNDLCRVYTTLGNNAKAGQFCQ